MRKWKMRFRCIYLTDDRVFLSLFIIKFKTNMIVSEFYLLTYYYYVNSMGPLYFFKLPYSYIV